MHGPADWPLIHVTLRGKNPDSPAVWVLTSYDSRPGSPGVEANATGLAATLAAAQALAGDTPDGERPLRVPAPRQRPGITDSRNRREILHGKSRFHRKPCSASKPWEPARNSGSARGTPTRSARLDSGTWIRPRRGSRLPRRGSWTSPACFLKWAFRPCALPPARSSLPKNPTINSPPPATVAASAGRLVELIRRCAAFAVNFPVAISDG